MRTIYLSLGNIVWIGDLYLDPEMWEEREGDNDYYGQW